MKPLKKLNVGVTDDQKRKKTSINDEDTRQRTNIKMVQNVFLMWVDNNIDHNNADCRNTVTQLRRVVNDINTFTDGEECIQFVDTINDNKACMIISGSLGQDIVPRVHNMSQVDSIFIFCGNKKRHEQWTKDWPKIKGVFTEITPICEALKQTAQPCEENSISISFIETSGDVSKRNLDHLDPSFMYTQILNFIISATNVDFNIYAIGRPLIDLVERLLARQEVHFIPHASTSDSPDSIIGILTISSFYTAITKRKTPFSVYRLLPIPFSFGGMRIRLADLPVAIELNFMSEHLIQWTQTEFVTCDFQAMSACRENPPIITHWQDTCLYQILTNSVLSACRTERHNDPLFLHRFGQQWIISTNNSQQCHLTVFSATDLPYVLSNQVRLIPAVALITVPPQTTLLCERFSIPASHKVVGPPLTIWDFTIVNNSQTPDFNFDPHLNNYTRWPKLPYIPDDFRAVYNYITNNMIPSPMPMPPLNELHRHPFGIFSITAFILILLLLTLLGYCHFFRYRSLASSLALDPIAENRHNY